MADDCIFCKLASGAIPTDFLYEDEDVAAFRDISPRQPVHILIIPKAHIPSLADITPEHQALLGKICLVAKKLAAENGVAESGYRLLTNCGADSGQEVPHLHFHLIGGQYLGPFCS
ncbi:MAG: histidine triad nucleotide-binding protein [Firmicutes bacterium]|nr:histidine triad nucleotide-binding protein [Bacillota bacterium]